MVNKFTKLCIAILIHLPILVYCQQQPMYSQYMFNGLALNPAYAGSHESLSLTALSRHQWLDIDGAPSTQTITAHAPVKNEKIGLGLMIMRDRIGVSNHHSASFAYAYKISIGKGILSSGLQFSLNQYRISYSKLNINNDYAFGQDDVSRIYPNFGAGAYYATPLFYAGFSSPNLIANKIDQSDPVTHLNTSRHYFFTSGYVIKLNNDLKLKPSLLIKSVDGAPLSIDLNSNLLIKNVVWVGVSYRSFHSLTSIIELQLTDQLRFGYAYDFPFSSKIDNWKVSSHEFMLNYSFTFLKYNSYSPRYF